MAFSLPSVTRTSDARPAWSGMAVLVEAMLVLAFLIASLAVVTQLFAKAAMRASEGEQLAQAVALATTTAERFAADPTGAEGSFAEGDLLVTCDVEATPAAAGTLFDATISVFAADDATSGQPVYVLATSCYEGGGR